MKRADDLDPELLELPLLRTLRPVGGYHIVRKIGEGPNGTVYEAEGPAPVEGRVAIKLVESTLNPRLVLARFATEREILERIAEPGIARVLDAGVSGDRAWFVTELFDGRSITEYCRARESGAVTRLNLFAQVCEIVDQAHRAGIVHRGIKPSNVVIGQDAGKIQIKITDFGIDRAVARHLGDDTRASRYASPEQRKGSEGLDARTDVYALGVLLEDLLEDVSHPRMRELREIVTRATALDANQRPATAWELVADVVRVVERVPALARASARVRDALRPIFHSPIPYAVIALALAGWLLTATLDMVRSRMTVANDAAQAADAAQAGPVTDPLIERTPPPTAPAPEPVETLPEQTVDEPPPRPEPAQPPPTRAERARQHFDAGRHGRAEKLYREILDERLRERGRGHPDTLNATDDLAQVYLAQGRFARAEPLLADAAALAEESLAGRLVTGRTLKLYGTCLMGLDQLHDAENALLVAHGILAQRLGNRHEQTVETVTMLVDLYERSAAPRAAAAWRARLPSS